MFGRKKKRIHRYTMDEYRRYLVCTCGMRWSERGWEVDCVRKQGFCPRCAQDVANMSTCIGRYVRREVRGCGIWGRRISNRKKFQERGTPFPWSMICRDPQHRLTNLVGLCDCYKKVYNNTFEIIVEEE